MAKNIPRVTGSGSGCSEYRAGNRKFPKIRKVKIKKVARSGGFWIATIGATNFGYLYHDLMNLGLKLFISGLITTYEHHSPLLSPLPLLSPSSLLCFILTS
jgi:hypothetical protein